MAINTEIERRFLVDGRYEKPWQEAETKLDITQHYLDWQNVSVADNTISLQGIMLTEISSDESVILQSFQNWVSRIRVQNDTVIFTAKRKNPDKTTQELEWDLSIQLENLTLSHLPTVKKTRYCWRDNDGNLWEVDEFEDNLAGLIIAEIELDNKSQSITIPEWAGIELTGLKNWSNASLSKTLLNAIELKNSLRLE